MPKKKRPPASKPNSSFTQVVTVLKQIASEDGRGRSRVAITSELLLDKILNPDKRVRVLQMLGITDFQFNPDTTVDNLVNAYIHQGTSEIVGLGNEISLNSQSAQESTITVRALLLTLVREANARGRDIVEIVSC